MRAWIMSDLHVDTAPYELPETPAGVDVIIIAGDITDGHHLSARWLLKQAIPRGLPVIFVSGNHDQYGHDLREDPVAMMADIGVHLLHERRPAVEIGGVRFVGSTLWTDYAVADDVDAARAWGRSHMPDMRNIDIGMRRIGTRDLLEAHQRQRETIESALAQPFDGTTVVVTHHAPHSRSLASPILTASDGSFASDLSSVIERYRPALWVHGHVHSSHDYQVGDTRIVCNARGYAVTTRDCRRIENSGFETTKVIEI